MPQTRLDTVKALTKAGVIGVNHHKQSDSLTRTLAEISPNLSKASENEGESSILPSRFYTDTVAAKQSLEDWAEQPLLIVILAE